MRLFQNLWTDGTGEKTPCTGPPRQSSHRTSAGGPDPSLQIPGAALPPCSCRSRFTWGFKFKHGHEARVKFMESAKHPFPSHPEFKYSHCWCQSFVPVDQWGQNSTMNCLLGKKWELGEFVCDLILGKLGRRAL